MSVQPQPGRSETMDHFPLLIITGRPAAGKSEVIDYLKKISAAERLARFHIGEFEELDDFPYVWETFEIDDILTRHGRPRLWTDEKYFFRDPFVWNLYIERISLEYRKRIARDPSYHRNKTVLVEFARGGEHGIEEALGFLHEEVLARARIVYIKVSYEESLRGTAGAPARGRRPPSCIIRSPMRRWHTITGRTIGKLLREQTRNISPSGATRFPTRCLRTSPRRPAIQRCLAKSWRV